MSLRYCCFFFPSPDLCCMWWLTRDEVKCFSVSAVSVNRPATTLTYDSSLIQVFYEFKQQRVCVCVCICWTFLAPAKEQKRIRQKRALACVLRLEPAEIVHNCVSHPLHDLNTPRLCFFFPFEERGKRPPFFFKVCCRVYEQRNKKGTIRLVEVSTRDTVCFIRALYVPSPSG